MVKPHFLITFNQNYEYEKTLHFTYIGITIH